MKVKSIVKRMFYCDNVELRTIKEETIYKGNIFDVPKALLKKKVSFDPDSEGDIFMENRVNNHGVNIHTLIIYVEK